MKHIEKIETEILNYFKSCGEKSRYVIALDKHNKSTYTGVTLHYIFKYTLKKRYSKTNVAAILLKMLNDEKIKCLFCPDVQKIVFNNLNSPYWSFDIKNYEFLFKNSYEINIKDRCLPTINFLKESYFNKFQNSTEMIESPVMGSNKIENSNS